VSRELQVAIAAARAGAAELAAARRGDLRVDYKDARANLVTVADHRSQQAISDVIVPVSHAKTQALGVQAAVAHEVADKFC